MTFHQLLPGLHQRIFILPRRFLLEEDRA